MVRVKPYKVGDIVTVRHCHGGYRLPLGLQDGATVRVLAFRDAFRRVEWEGEEFEVYMANVDSGLEPVPPTSRGRRGGNMD